MEGTDESYTRDILLVAQTARELGLQEVDPQLFVRDLGVAKLPCQDEDRPAAEGSTKRKSQAGDLVARLRLAQQLKAQLDSGEYENQAQLARALELSRARITQILNVLRLCPDIQERLLGCGHEVRVSEHRLRRVLKEQDPGKQREMLGDVLGDLTDDEQPVEPDQTRLKQLRLVAYFNPRMFVDQRRRAQEHLDELSRFVEELNQELSQARQPRKEDPTRRKLPRQLGRYDYTDAFDVSLEPIEVTTPTGGQVGSFRCQLQLKQDIWSQRRRYDGFVLLLGHPDLPQSGKELALLYRGKDVIEKDFQTIRSAVKLRPIYSHTNPKVQAHVTLCMLALLLNRSLEHRLRQANVALTTPACLEVLATCHLNRVTHRPAGRTVYSVTEPTTAQRELLTALDLGHLTDDAAVREALSA